MNFTTVTLKGRGVQLEPLHESHQAELYQAAQDKTIWTYHLSNAYGEQFYTWFAKALKNAQLKLHHPFIVRKLADHAIIGSTRYYDLHMEHLRLAIGNTWYIPQTWGTYVNPECKYLLLQYAFEKLQINRVEFFTNLRNLHSQAALKKLGAKEEGVLRHHMILENGVVRDSVMFSIICPEWPELKTKLQERIEKLLLKHAIKEQ